MTVRSKPVHLIKYELVFESVQIQVLFFIKRYGITRCVIKSSSFSCSPFSDMLRSSPDGRCSNILSVSTPYQSV